MPVNNPEQKYDIAILGGGISSSLTLLHLLRNMLSSNEGRKETRIAVVEKQSEFWKGFPYGKRSSINSLTITTLGEFVPEKEKELFIDWLRSTQDKWIGLLKTNGGLAAKEWIDNNLPMIKKNEWEEIYIPRFLFGDYVDEKLVAMIQKAQQKNIANIQLIEAEAINILRKDGNSYEAQLKDNNGRMSSLIAEKIILAIGSPPVKSVQPKTAEKTGYAYIDDIYLPGIEDNIEKVEEIFSGITDADKRNVLIVGSNASTLEFLYLVHHRPAFKKLLNKIIAVSYSGLLPHRITPNNFPDYQFINLISLAKKNNYSSAELMDTIEKDIRIAYSKGVHIGDTYYQLSDLVVQLLNKLDVSEQKHFHSAFGWRFTKLIRRAGAEYRDAAEELLQEKKLELLKGKFLEVKLYPKEPGFGIFHYENTANKQVEHPLLFPVVINCSGFEELDACSSEIINNLIKQELCKVNSTNRGFEVSEKFEASDNLYIVGPLLGGIFNDKLRYWHVENARRIYTVGSMLADILVNQA
ncbi:MAG: FAD/NAD(P)-binding protein [Bacteroidetes bacterium]|nr:FAD/NAD(P)-binding protein [Bacteroidota bacterium]